MAFSFRNRFGNGEHAACVAHPDYLAETVESKSEFTVFRNRHEFLADGNLGYSGIRKHYRF